MIEAFGLAGVMLLGCVLLGLGAWLEARSRPRGGQRIARNAPRPPVQSTIPGPPPRGHRVTRSPGTE